MLRQMICAWMPWHRIVEQKRISAQSDYLRCSCGREYGLNYVAGGMVPWEMVRAFYERRAKKGR